MLSQNTLRTALRNTKRKGLAINPLGPNPNLEATSSQSVTHKVYRGGSWNQVETELRSANRRGSRYQLRAEGIGFRCARTFIKTN